eukprot:1469761-Heterocapsa_arctica.AAC.1
MQHITLITENLARKAVMLLGRLALWVVYTYYLIDKANGSVFDIQDVITCAMHRNDMEDFLNRWDTVLLGRTSQMDMDFMQLPLF